MLAILKFIIKIAAVIVTCVLLYSYIQSKSKTPTIEEIKEISAGEWQNATNYL